jgi:transposase
MALRVRRTLTTEERVWITNESAKNGNCQFRTQERWPFDNPAPHHLTVKRILAKYSITGSILHKKGGGRPRTVRTDENINRVKAIIEEDSSTSSTAMARELDISIGSTIYLLKDAKLMPFRATDVQFLTEEDFERRYTKQNMRYILTSIKETLNRCYLQK